MALRAINADFPRAAAIYCRISDDREGEQLGVKRQREDCVALARRKGWPVAAFYIDNDVNANGRKPRPEYERMLADVRAGTIDGMVVWHLDRLHRSPRELEDFFTTCDRAGVSHLATVTGDVNLATDDGRFHARIMGAVARKESDDKSRRIKRKHEQLAADGKLHGGGTRPFGYEQDRRTIRQSEAKVIRDGARRIIAGDSLRSVTRDWNDRGVLTSAGKVWLISAVHRVLMSGRICGWREHHGELIAKASWPGIVTREQSDRLRAILGDPARRKNLTSRRYLLTGFLRCGRCKGLLVARPRGDKKRCYICAKPYEDRRGGCGRLKTLSEPVEELVTAMLFKALDSEELAKALRKRERAATGDEQAADSIAADEDRLAQLARDFGENRIGRAEWIAAREPIQRRIDTARARISREQRTVALDPFVGKRGSLAKAWEHMDLDRQRAVIAAVIEHVVIGPAVRGLNRFDPSRVSVVWKF